MMEKLLRIEGKEGEYIKQVRLLWCLDSLHLPSNIDCFSVKRNNYCYRYISLKYTPPGGVPPMKMLSPKDVAAITGLPYIKALALVKSTNHIQIDNRYYVTESVLRAFLNPSTALKITTI